MRTNSISPKPSPLKLSNPKIRLTESDEHTVTEIESLEKTGFIAGAMFD